MKPVRSSSEIDPEKLYPFAVAALFVPSSSSDGPITVATLHNWRIAGRVPALSRTSGDRTYWFVRGRDLLSLIFDEKPDAKESA